MNALPDLFGRYAWGIASVSGKFVYYERVDEWKAEQRPGAAGGVLTVQIRTGRQIWRARVLYADEMLELTPDIEAAIEIDQQRHVEKTGS